MALKKQKGVGFKVKGAIFDVDDTLLDNGRPGAGHGLHERSRLVAVHEVGRRHNIKALEEFSVEANFVAFAEASVHTLEGAMWNTLVLTGLMHTQEIDHDYPLLQEMVSLKNHLHEDILRQEGKALPGAVAFVKAIAANGLADKLAIASTSIRRDIDIFFDMTGLDALFPDERIISKELITLPKPDPQIFNLAFVALGLPEADRSQVCAFEDDPRGIKAARGAGLYTCAITSRYTREVLAALSTAPHFIADSYREFADFFGLVLE